MQMFTAARNLFCLSLWLVISAGCTPSGSETRLASSNYYLIESGNVQRYIWKKSDNDKRIVVDSAVVAHKATSVGAAAVRQIVNSYECDERTIATEVLDRYEYWIIDFESDKVVGPLTADQFSNNVSKYQGLDLPNETQLRASMSLRPHKLVECTNPRLLQ